jgi:hypothetical protein
MFRAATHTRSRRTPTVLPSIQSEGLLANAARDDAAAVSALEVSIPEILGRMDENFLAPRILIPPVLARKTVNWVASALRALSPKTAALKV